MTAKTICADCRFAEWGSDTLGLGMGTCAWRPKESAAAALSNSKFLPIRSIPGAWAFHQSCPVYERKNDDPS
jgi:hypothetical protein